MQLQFNDLVTHARVESVLRIHVCAVDCDDVVPCFHMRAFELFVPWVKHLQLVVVDLEHASGDGCCRGWQIEHDRGNLHASRLYFVVLILLHPLVFAVFVLSSCFVAAFIYLLTTSDFRLVFVFSLDALR